MKITEWTSWDNEKYEDLPDKMMAEAFKVVVDEVKKKGYKFSGKTHQYNEKGCPVIDGRYKYNVSCRMWGDVMADAYNLYEGESDTFAYVEWAWTPRCTGVDENGKLIFEEEILPS